jgi:hypothetical protein
MQGVNMSFIETSKAFQKSEAITSEQEISKILGQYLRKIFPDSKKGIKAISRDMGADVRTVWNWYNGLNMPSLGNLALLAKAYPGIAKPILEILGRTDIWEGYEKQVMISETDLKRYENHQKSEFYSDIFVGINLSHNVKMNQRQLWFIKRLQLGFEVKAANIEKFWNISARTAERDVSVLVQNQIIKFVGSKKKGAFRLYI